MLNAVFTLDMRSFYVLLRYKISA